MRARHTLLRFWLILPIVLSGSCGGGGGSSVINQRTFTVDGSSEYQTTIGETMLTFPAGAFPGTTTVTLTESVPPNLPQSAFSTRQPQLTLNATNSASAFDVEYPDDGATDPPLAALLDHGQPIGTLPVSHEKNRFVIHFSPSFLPQRQARSSSFTLTLLLGVLTHYAPVDTHTALVPIGSSAPNGKILVFVHGLLQGERTDEATIQQLKTEGGYGIAYSFAYDWRSPINLAAQGLATALNGLPAKQVDVVGYSKGGLVTRWALERLGATNSVRRAMFLATPNTGCAITHELLFTALMTRWLKSPLALVGVLDANDNCLAELMPTSSRLSELNTVTLEQHGNVDYLFVAGDAILNGDTIVGRDSALLNRPDVADNLTNGIVRRFTLVGTNHFGVDDPEPASIAYRQLPGVDLEGISLSLDQNPVEANPIDGSWHYTLFVTNASANPLTLDSLQFELFDANGMWTTHQWYDPTSPLGTFYPFHYSRWGEVIQPGQSKQLLLQTWANPDQSPVWLAPSDRQAETVHFIVQATGADGRHVEEHLPYVALTYGGHTPLGPQFRAKPIHPNGVISPTGPGRYKELR